MTFLETLKNCALDAHLPFKIDEDNRFIYVGDIIWDCNAYHTDIYERSAESMIASALSRFSDQCKKERERWLEKNSK